MLVLYALVFAHQSVLDLVNRKRHAEGFDVALRTEQFDERHSIDSGKNEGEIGIEKGCRFVARYKRPFTAPSSSRVGARMTHVGQGFELFPMKRSFALKAKPESLTAKSSTAASTRCVVKYKGSHRLVSTVSLLGSVSRNDALIQLRLNHAGGSVFAHLLDNFDDEDRGE